MFWLGPSKSAKSLTKENSISFPLNFIHIIDPIKAQTIISFRNVVKINVRLPGQ